MLNETEQENLKGFLNDYRGVCEKFCLQFGGLIFVEKFNKIRLDVQIGEFIKEGIESD